MIVAQGATGDLCISAFGRPDRPLEWRRSAQETLLLFTLFELVTYPSVEDQKYTYAGGMFRHWRPFADENR